MRRAIDPTVSTFLDVFTCEFRGDAGLEQRMFEAIVACIERATGNPEPLRLLFVASRQLRKGFREHLEIPFDTLHAARALEPVTSAIRQREQETNVDGAIALGMVLGERASLAQHAAKFRMRKGEVQRAMFDRPVCITALGHCAQHALEAYNAAAEAIALHLAILDADLFRELAGLRWKPEETNQILVKPFPEADLIAAGFPTVEERLRYSTGNPKMRV